MKETKSTLQDGELMFIEIQAWSDISVTTLERWAREGKLKTYERLSHGGFPCLVSTRPDMLDCAEIVLAEGVERLILLKKLDWLLRKNQGEKKPEVATALRDTLKTRRTHHQLQQETTRPPMQRPTVIVFDCCDADCEEVARLLNNIAGISGLVKSSSHGQSRLYYKCLYPRDLAMTIARINGRLGRFGKAQEEKGVFPPPDI